MNENQQAASVIEKVDLYSIFRDTLRNLWVIILGALAVGMIINMSVRPDYKSTYSTTATCVVTSKTNSSSTYSNLASASTMASSFSNILNSRILQKKVCEDLNLESFNASTAANVVGGTNLMTLRVTADTPKNTYQITRSIMKNISDLTQYVSTDMVMDVLQQPVVPTKADASFSAFSQSIRAFILSFFAFAAVFMYLSFRKETIKSEKDLENLLDAKSLGMLYYEGKFSSLGGFLKGKKNRLLVTDLSAKFEFVERVKKIGAHISSEAHKRNAKVILFTSLQEHEGKSTVSANVALTLVQQSYRVLLIDGDLRRPTLQKLMLASGEKFKVTLAALLTGKAELKDALIRHKEKNLFMLLNKRNFPNSTDIVSSDTMAKLIESARKHFDFIIIDSPPMSIMADAEVLANLSDMSVLVVKYDTALAQDLNDVIDSLRDCRAEFAGCILNEVRTLPGARRTVGGYGGYGRYGKYGKYGRYGRYGKYGRYGNYETKGEARSETGEQSQE